MKSNSHRIGRLGRIVAGYGIAVLCVACAVGVRLALGAAIGAESPFMIFAPAALLAARFGGLGPGIAALLAGLLLGDYLFTPPLHSWGPYGPVEITRVVTYTITTLVGVILFHLLRRSQERLRLAAGDAHEMAGQAQLRATELEREVAERKRAEEALQNAQDQLTAYSDNLEAQVAERTASLKQSVQSLEAVLYHVAHDLRAPLRAMQGFTTMISRQYEGKLDATGEDYARRVSDAARRMDQLLQDLLEYGRVCHADLQYSEVDLESLVNQLCRRTANEIDKRQATVKIANPLPTAWADARLLGEILSHLLANALKFGRPGHELRIEIGADEADGYIQCWVMDNGQGIPQKHQERIFGVFERLNPDPADASTGIGLAIVHKAVLRMGGTVGVASQPGEGSRFWFNLPRKHNAKP